MSSQQKTKYHHGNLRESLLSTARELASEVGVDAFTLRELARRAGVSQAAPYHHFSDKAALVRALAIEAFKNLSQQMQTAKSQHTDAIQSLQAAGMAYVDFALTHSTEFRFMFRHELQKPAISSGELEQVSREAFQVLAESIAACKQAGILAETDLRLQAMTAWSAVHGLASILLDGSQQEIVPELENKNLAAAVLQTLWFGLGARK